jgi:hypothetical protein
MPRLSPSIAILALLYFAPIVLGQFTTVINVPPDTAPGFIGSDTQLNVTDGGVLGGQFQAGLPGATHTNMEVNVSGGTVGFPVGNSSYVGFSGSTTNFSGGEIYSRVIALEGSGLNISGGTFHSMVEGHTGSIVTISGGDLRRGFGFSGSHAEISGGSFADGLRTHGETALELVGGALRLDGLPIAGLESPGDMLAFELPRESVLSGVFVDGTPFAFSSIDSDYLESGILSLRVADVPVAVPTRITASTDPVPLGIRTGQMLVVDQNSTIRDNFNAGRDSIVNITGGIVGSNLEAFSAALTLSDGTLGSHFDAFHGTTVAIAGGAVGNEFDAFHGATVEITGGAIGWHFRARGSRVNISGGSIGPQFEVSDGSEVNVSGGTIHNLFQARDGSVVNIAGGSIGQAFDVRNGVVVNITGGTVGSHMRVHSGSAVNISGGQIGDVLEAFSGTIVSISEGTIGGNFTASSGSVVNVFGGEVGESFTAERDAEVFILDGTVGNNFMAEDGSKVDISGGSIGRQFTAYTGSEVHISGGTIGELFRMFGTGGITGGSIGDHGNVRGPARISGGSFGDDFSGGDQLEISGGKFGDGFTADRDGTIRISGGSFGDSFEADESVVLAGDEFRLDGVPIAGLDTVGDMVAVDATTGAVLSGTLADGTPFAFSRRDSSTLSSRDGDFVHIPTLKLAELLPPGPPLTVASTDPLPLGLRETQTLLVDDNAVIPPNFNAGWGSEVNVAGGAVDRNLEAVGAVVRMTSGSIGNGFDAFTGSEVRVTGGSIGRRFQAFSGSRVEISGGTIADGMHAISGSDVTISGGDFRLDGQPIAGLEAVGDAFALDFDQDGTPQLLAGTLADGTPFSVFTGGLNPDRFDTGTLTLRLSELPEIVPLQFRSSTGHVPLGIRSGQTLRVDAGAIPDDFNAGPGSTVVVEGGTVGDNLEAVAATILVSAGAIGDQFDAFSGSVVEMTGGSIGDNFRNYGSEVRVSGGSVGDSFWAVDGSVHLEDANAGDDFRLYGGVHSIIRGQIGDDFVVGQDTVVDIAGSTIGRFAAVQTGAVANIYGGSAELNFRVYDGSELNIFGGTIGSALHVIGDSEVRVYGTDFRINGVPVDGVVPGESFLVTERTGVLTGELLDGASLELVLDPSYAFTGVDEDARLFIVLSTALDGDYNNNGLVEQSDLDLVLSHWGRAAAVPPVGWINHLPSGTIDQNELDSVLANWGRTTAELLAESGAIPEPRSAALLLAAVLAAAVLRRVFAIRAATLS